MIADLKPYPAYKDSGVEWLGQVPEGWEVSRLEKSILNCINGVWGDEPNGKNDLPCIRVADFDRERLRVRSKIPTKRSIPSNEVPRRLLKSGDLLLEKSGGGDNQPVGVVILFNQQLMAVCSNFIAKMSIRQGFDPMFLTFLHSTLYKIGLNKRSIKQTTGIQNLDSANYLRELVAFPPLAEQAAIVKYLNHVDRKVRRFVRAKRKLIALLEEQKRAIIHQAVTRGLDPNVPMKDSGIEWLGEVPEGWEVVRLKDVAIVQTGITLGKNYKGVSTQSYPYLRVANVQVGRLDLNEVKEIQVPEREALSATLKSGDVLMTEGGDIDKLGRGCVWRGEVPRCLHQNHVFAVRCSSDALEPEFLVGLMGSQHGRIYFQLTAKKTTNLASTNSTILKAFPILLPSIAEQRQILQDIAQKSIELNAMLSNTQREISLIEEYRTRLISDVVTGKLDVREAAAALPEEVEGEEPEEIETDEGGEVEEETDQLLEEDV